MKWLGGRSSGNIEDRRGMSGGKMVAGGGIGAAIIYLLINFVFGSDAADLASQMQQPSQETDARGVTPTNDASDDQMAKFADNTLALTEDVWNKIFQENGGQYREPVMVLFKDRTSSGCGAASSATGPFYCPTDQKVYLDLSFFSDLKNRFGASGDFANAYVIAHEVGHHVQNLLGTSEKIQNAMQHAGSKEEANKLSVALELQADFYAGVWAHHTQEFKNVMQIEQGDLEEALNAAQAIGDDRLQKMGGGVVQPESFTHGTSAQRMRWFKAGFESGDIKQGNTFKEAF